MKKELKRKVGTGDLIGKKIHLTFDTLALKACEGRLLKPNPEIMQ